MFYSTFFTIFVLQIRITMNSFEKIQLQHEKWKQIDNKRGTILFYSFIICWIIPLLLLILMSFFEIQIPSIKYITEKENCYLGAICLFTPLFLYFRFLILSACRTYEN